MLRIENRFVVMSLMEDLLFPGTLGASDGGAPVGDAADGKDVLPSAATMDSRAESVAEVAPAWEEPPERCAARARAIKHLPSLSLTMGLQWARAEVVPYLLRCIAEDESQLSEAVAEVLPPLLQVRCSNLHAASDPPQFAFSVDSLKPVLMRLCVARNSSVRSKTLRVVDEGILPAIRDAASLESLVALGKDLLLSGWPVGVQSCVALFLSLWVFVMPDRLQSSRVPFGKTVGTVRTVVAQQLRELLAALDSDERPHELVLKALAEGMPKIAQAAASGTSIWGSAGSSYAHIPQSFCAILGITDINVVSASQFCVEGCSPPMGWLEANWQTVSAAATAVSPTIDALSKLLPGPEISRVTGTLLGAVTSFHMHPHWKVRYAVATSIAPMFALAFCGSPRSDMSSIRGFFDIVVQRLCTDTEEEVRVAASRRLGSLLGFLAESNDAYRGAEVEIFVVERLLECCLPLASDECAAAREGLVESLAEACGLLHAAVARRAHDRRFAAVVKEAEDTMLRIITDLLHDDSIPVQLAVVNKLDVFICYFGSGSVERSLLELCDKLQLCDAWRVRLAFVEILPRLCVHIYKLVHGGGLSAADEHSISTFMSTELFPRLAAMVFDRAKAVRARAIQAVKEMSASLGDGDPNKLREFVDQVFWQHIARRPEAEQSYLSRSTLVAAAIELNIHHDTLLRPLVERLSCDPIANVRMAVARCLGECLHKPQGESFAQPSSVDGTAFSSQEINGWVISILRTLVEDSDTDVRHFASGALSRCF